MNTLIEHDDPESTKNRICNPIWNALYSELNHIDCDELMDNSFIETGKFISDLDSEEWLVRDNAVLALANGGQASSAAVSQLLPLLHDEEWIVRRSTVYALSKIITIDNARVWNEIGNLRNDPEEHVRIEVALALGRKGQSE